MYEILDAVFERCGFPESHCRPNSCNVNLYDGPRSSVDWHSDNEAMFQGASAPIRILSLSLGEPRTFQLKPKGWHGATHTSIKLFSGDLLLMDGCVQQYYLHKVPKESQLGKRINLTWRWVVTHQEGCGASPL